MICSADRVKARVKGRNRFAFGTPGRNKEQKQRTDDRMSDAAELEERVRAAFARIETAASELALPAEPAEDLVEELEAQKAANVELEKRIASIQSNQEGLIATLQSEIAELKNALGARDEAVKTVRRMNGKLRNMNRALRKANASGLSDAGLINEAMAAELEALRVLQRSDRAEIDDLVAAITPFVEEAESA